MNSWYNDTIKSAKTLDDLKKENDWINNNRFQKQGVQYNTIYAPISFLSKPELPDALRDAYGKGIRHGFAYSSIKEIDAAIKYNQVNTDVRAKMSHIVSEIEPYNDGDYYACTVAIQYAYSRAKINGFIPVIYMGWPKDSYWDTIVQNCDEINLHCYIASKNVSASAIWGYVKGRLNLIASACATHNKHIKINILYSCEPAFSMDYFKINAWANIHALFMSAYNANASLEVRSFLSFPEFSIFVSSFGKQIVHPIVVIPPVNPTFKDATIGDVKMAGEKTVDIKKARRKL